MFVWLAIITGAVVWSLAAGRINPDLEWGVFPLLLLPWSAAVFFLQRHLKPASTASGDQTVTDSFRAALQSNRTERANLRLAAGLLALLVPVLALVMQQVHAAGKVSGRELTSMGLFFGAALLAGLGGMAVRYFVRLQPQRKRLETLLAELREEHK